MPRSPVHDGFRAVLRQPGVVIAEIVWRWSFGTAMLALLGVAAVQFLKSIPVSNNDLLELRTGTPFLMADALAHMLQGTGGRLLRATAILLPSLMLLWTIAASVGRAATLKGLLEGSRANLGTLLGIHFLRSVLGLAGFAAYVGAAALAGAVSRPDADGIGVFMAVFLAQMFIVVFVGGVLNWYLSLAPLAAARSGGDTMVAIANAFNAARRHAGGLSQVSLMFAVLRAVPLLMVTLVSLGIFGQVTPQHWRAATVIVAAISLVYFTLADFLYLARLAAYNAVMDEEVAHSPANAAAPSVTQAVV